MKTCETKLGLHERNFFLPQITTPMLNYLNQDMQTTRNNSKPMKMEQFEETYRQRWNHFPHDLNMERITSVWTEILLYKWRRRL